MSAGRRRPHRVLLHESDDRERFPEAGGIHAGLLTRSYSTIFLSSIAAANSARRPRRHELDEYRLKVMKEVGENLVVRNARQVNPKIHLIIKPPNWYEQYQFSGYNLRRSRKRST